MACPSFPDSEVREILERTANTGNEHAVIMCSDGSTTNIVSGTETRTSIEDALKECDGDGPYSVVHTHPNGVKRLSDQDRKVAAHEDIGSVCVAVEGGEVLCESVDTCEREVST